MSFSEDSGHSPLIRHDSRSPSTGSNLNHHPPPAWLNTFVRGMSDEQYQDQRKQSLDCTTIKVSIPAASTTTKKPGDPPHTIYILHVTSGITQWNIRRRYSDFYYIHHLLKKYVLEENFPQLPPKRYFGSNDSKFIEERRIQLERYIKTLVSIPQAWTRIDIVQFLDNENNTLLFVWNFEKMRKMQDVSHLSLCSRCLSLSLPRLCLCLSLCLSLDLLTASHCLSSLLLSASGARENDNRKQKSNRKIN
jgi:hypothetical protein